MLTPPIPLQPLAKAQIAVWRLRAMFRAVPLLALTAVAVVALISRGLAGGWLFVPVIAYIGWRVAISPQRRWRLWGYAFSGDELHVASGWIVRSHTIVPVVRVQHIDLSQGPIERRYDIVTLTLHTAGSEANVVVLPGITRATGEEIRDEIRSAIRQRGQ